jgi:hypothetical protein
MLVDILRAVVFFRRMLLFRRRMLVFQLPTSVSNIADNRQPLCRQLSATLPTAVGNSLVSELRHIVSECRE